MREREQDAPTTILGQSFAKWREHLAPVFLFTLRIFTKSDARRYNLNSPHLVAPPRLASRPPHQGGELETQSDGFFVPLANYEDKKKGSAIQLSHLF